MKRSCLIGFVALIWLLSQCHCSKSLLCFWLRSGLCASQFFLSRLKLRFGCSPFRSIENLKIKVFMQAVADHFIVMLKYIGFEGVGREIRMRALVDFHVSCHFEARPLKCWVLFLSSRHFRSLVVFQSRG